MATAQQNYEQLARRVTEQARENGGKVDPKLKADKASAFNALRDEQRKEARAQKRGLQENYIRSFPSEHQRAVRERLAAAGK